MSVMAGKPDGWGEIVQVKEKKDKFGLGYEPFQQKRAHSPQANYQKNFQEVFLSGGVIHGHQVNAADEVSTADDTDLVRRCAPDEELNNWKAEELLVSFPLSK